MHRGFRVWEPKASIRIEMIEQSYGDARSDARSAHEQCVEADDHHRPHLIMSHLWSETDGMGSNEVELQVLQPL